jgi:hypothetical protein
MTEIIPAPKFELIDIEREMLKYEQVDVPLYHHWSGGVYIREIRIPAGSYIMGKRHRYETCNILLKGTLLVYVDDGKPPVPMTGPVIFTTQPNAKKFAYCQEEAIFLNIIPTKETDPEEIERLFIIPEQEYQEALCHSSQQLFPGESRPPAELPVPS